jgi:hypothetical protein
MTDYERGAQDMRSTCTAVLEGERDHYLDNPSITLGHLVYAAVLSGQAQCLQHAINQIAKVKLPTPSGQE